MIIRQYNQVLGKEIIVGSKQIQDVEYLQSLVFIIIEIQKIVCMRILA